MALDIISALSAGTDAMSYTGNTFDGLLASGYSSAVQAITGAPPSIINLGNNRAQVVLSQDQVIAMQKYLDRLVGLGKGPASAAVPSPQTGRPSGLDLNIMPVALPWALKFIIPLSVALILAGWFAHSAFGGK